jgi:hypothetical protein
MHYKDTAKLVLTFVSIAPQYDLTVAGAWCFRLLGFEFSSHGFVVSSVLLQDHINLVHLGQQYKYEDDSRSSTYKISGERKEECLKVFILSFYNRYG